MGDNLSIGPAHSQMDCRMWESAVYTMGTGCLSSSNSSYYVEWLSEYVCVCVKGLPEFNRPPPYMSGSSGFRPYRDELDEWL